MKKHKLKFLVWYPWLTPTIMFLLLFSNYVMSDSWWPNRHLLPCPSHAKVPCPSQSPRVCSDSCLWSWWCHPNSSSSVAPFSSCPQSFPASGSSHQLVTSHRLVTSARQSIGASASVLPMNIQGWFPLWLTGLISFAVQGTLKSLVQHHNLKALITAISVNRDVTIVSNCSPPKWAGEPWGNSGWIPAI